MTVMKSTPESCRTRSASGWMVALGSAFPSAATSVGESARVCATATARSVAVVRALRRASYAARPSALTTSATTTRTCSTRICRATEGSRLLVRPRMAALCRTRWM